MEANVEEKPENPPRADLFLTFKPALLDHLAALLGLLTVLGIFRFQALVHINSHYLGGFQGDAGLYSWLIESNIRDLLRLPWFDTFSFYPYGYSLAWSDNFILPSAAALGLTGAGFSQPLVFNIIILLSNFLNGYVTYRLHYKLTGEQLNAFSVGAVFMTLSYFSFNLGHPQLQFFFWIPLLFILLINFFNSPGLLWAIISGLCLCATFLTTVYYSIFAVVFAAVLLCGIVLLRPRYLSKLEIAELAVGGAIGFAPVIAFVLPYLEVRNTFGARNIYEAYYFSASALSFLSAPPHNLLYGVTSKLSRPEAHFFPGLTLLIISLLALRRLGDAPKLKPWLHALTAFILGLFALSLLESSALSRFISAMLLWACLGTFAGILYLLGALERKLGFATLTARDLIGIFGLAALLFMILAFGPQGNPQKGDPALAPYRLFYEVLPGFDSIRAIARTGAVYLFSLCILFGLELSYFSTRRTLGMALLLPTLFVLIENYQTAYPLESEPASPAVLSELSKIKKGTGSIIALPFAGKLDADNEVESWGEFAALNVTYMHWLFPYEIPAINGYSGQKTKLMKELPRELRGFPSTRSVNALSSIGGLRYIVYFSQFDKEFSAFEFQKRLSELSPALKLLHDDEHGGYLFEVSSEIAVDEDVAIWLPSKPGSVLVLDAKSAIKSKDARITVEVYMKDEFDLLLAGTLDLIPDQNWARHELKLPEAQNRVRPVQISFQPKKDARILIRNVHLAEAISTVTQ